MLGTILHVADHDGVEDHDQDFAADPFANLIVDEGRGGTAYGVSWKYFAHFRIVSPRRPRLSRCGRSYLISSRNYRRSWQHTKPQNGCSLRVPGWTFRVVV